MLNLKFDEAKATQIAARFLKHEGGKISYLKLIKLMYFVDREALARWGRPATFDQFFSMPQGQVLSKTLDLIDEGVPPGEVDKSYWLRHISVPSNYEVKLKKPAPTDELSEAEVRLIDEIYQKYGKFNKWQLRDIHHNLPEYVEPFGSCVRTEYEDILRVFGKTDAQISAIMGELKHLESAQSILEK